MEKEIKLAHVLVENGVNTRLIERFPRELLLLLQGKLGMDMPFVITSAVMEVFASGDGHDHEIGGLGAAVRLNCWIEVSSLKFHLIPVEPNLQGKMALLARVFSEQPEWSEATATISNRPILTTDYSVIPRNDRSLYERQMRTLASFWNNEPKRLEQLLLNSSDAQELFVSIVRSLCSLED